MRKTEHKNKPDKQVVAANIRQLRRSKNLTIQELADAIGVTKVSVCHYESGDYRPSSYNLLQLAEYFGISIHELTSPGNISIAEKIRLGRRSKNMTQLDLARRINADQRLIACWESGQHEPRLETKKLLNEILDINL